MAMQYCNVGTSCANVKILRLPLHWSCFNKKFRHPCVRTKTETGRSLVEICKELSLPVIETCKEPTNLKTYSLFN